MEFFSIWTYAFLFFLLFSIYGIWPFIRYYRLFKLPGPIPLPFLGNLISIMKEGSLHNAQQIHLKKYGKIYRQWSARMPEIVITDLEFMREILLKNFWSFSNRRPLGLKFPNMERSLLCLVNPDWKHSRSFITPTFSSGKLKMMIPMLHRAADNLLKNMDNYGKSGKPAQLKDVFGSFVMDTIASTAFGLDVNSHNDIDNAFTKNAKNTFGDPKLLFNPLLFFIALFPFLIPLFNYLGFYIFPKEKTDFFVDVTKQAIEMRRKDNNSQKGVDFLYLMIKAHELRTEQEEEVSAEDNENSGVIQPFSDEDVISNALTFFLAGYETTGTNLCLTAYLLATNPEVQKKLVEEVDVITEGREDFSYETLKDMPYLEMVFCESLRIFPPIANFDREAARDITINGIFIPQSTIVTISMYNVHRDPEVYPEPEKFIPERFSKEERGKRSPLSYIPFGYGARNCVGMRFAILESKLVLVRILQKLTFDTCEQTQIPPKLGPAGFLSPPDGVILKLVPRKKTE